MRSLVQVVASGLLMSAGAQAFAQTTAAEPSQDQRAAAEAPVRSDEILVTARRRDERIQDVPISISAFGGASLEARLMGTTEVLTQIAPNMQFSPVAPSSGNHFTSAVFIRGVGQTDFIGSTDPGVGFYLDGVYFARAAGTAVSLLDVERVEVLRGPQGTLFGRNTVGGAIQVITNKPRFDEFSGRLTGTVGEFNRRDAVGVLNIPVSDVFAIRAAAITRNKDGYVTNILDGRDLANVEGFSGRLSARLTPTPDLEFLLVTDYMSERSNGSPTVFAGINTSAAFVRLAAGNAGCPGFVQPNPVPETDGIDLRCPNNQFLSLSPFQVASNAPTDVQLEMFGAYFTATWDVSDSMTLRSITAHRHSAPYSLRDADNTPLQILETINEDDVDQFTQEFQILGRAFSDRLNWQAGAYYFKETDEQFYPVYLPSSISPTTGEELQVGGSRSDASIENESYAVYAQATFDFTEAFNLTLGGRYTNDTKQATPHQLPSPTIAGFVNVGYNVPNPPPLPGIVCLGPPRAAGVPCTGDTDTLFDEVLNEREDSKFTPMASLQYRWSENLMTYLSYSEGFKSGGFNTRIVQPVISPNAPTGREFLPAFSPETVSAYEIGAKVDLNEYGRLSGAVFRSEYEDIHIVVREGIAPVVRNAGSATITGFEVEGYLTPTSAFAVDFGIGYTNFEYQSFTDALLAGQAGAAPHSRGVVDLDDKQAYSPEWSGNLGLSYTFNVGDSELVARVDGAYRSETFFDAPNTPEISQPSYSVYNASLRYIAPGDRFSLGAGVTNFTDEEYRVSGNSSLAAASGYAEVTYAPPRQWFVEVSVAF